jgi:hypothetical protein
MFISPAKNTFRYTFSWLILSALFFVPILIWQIYDYSQTHQMEPGLAFFTVISGLFVAYAWWWTKTRVTIHDEGICYKSPFGEKELRWDEITETRYGQQAMNAGAHFGLLGWLIAAIASSNKMIRSFELIGPNKIAINSNTRDVEEVVRLVLAAVNPRLRQDAERILNSGGTVAFGKISLSPGGVIWKSKEPIPYNALMKCKIDGQMLRIKAEGKWLDNIAITAKKVPNIFVLLDLIEEKRSTMSGKAVPAMSGSSAHQYL